MGQKRDKDGRTGRVHLNASAQISQTPIPTIVSTRRIIESCNNNERIKKKKKKQKKLIKKRKKKNFVLGTTLPKGRGGGRGDRVVRRKKVYLIKITKRYKESEKPVTTRIKK